MNPIDTNQASEDTQKAPTRTLSEQHAQRGTATGPIISDTSQASEDELQRELERLYKCVVYDLIDDVDRKELWIKEVGIVVEALIRTEKLKLLAEVRERVVGEDKRPTGSMTGLITIDVARNKLRAEMRNELTKLEAEL